MVVDNMFFLAVGAFGWGLSLFTYRMFANGNGWPMGSLHNDLPAVPAILGLCAFLAGLSFAAARVENDGGWFIVLFGVLLAIFWTGFLRVGSQISLFLAPIAAALLLIGWLSDFDKVRWLRSDLPAQYYDHQRLASEGSRTGPAAFAADVE
jgi:hypothetical protein